VGPPRTGVCIGKESLSIGFSEPGNAGLIDARWRASTHAKKKKQNKNLTIFNFLVIKYGLKWCNFYHKISVKML
jgi:hypothetical protein